VVEIVAEEQWDTWSTHLCGMLGLRHIQLFQSLSEEERLMGKGRNASESPFCYSVDLASLVSAIAQLQDGAGANRWDPPHLGPPLGAARVT
jgi:hypothetical protein